MGKKIDVFPGARIGRWTVLAESGEGAERRWRCRCDCGTERDVLDRGLRYGGSVSCGCLKYEQLAYKREQQMVGREFGELTVIMREETDGRNGGFWWKCRCSCGNELSVPGTLLETGRKTHCGCKTERKYPFTDITGQRFHRLTAVRPLSARTSGGNVVWLCRCDCGNEVQASYNVLAYGNIKSCGCQKKEHDARMKDLMIRVDGTSIQHLRSRKIPTDNTTGVRGVYMIRGKYVAKLVFQKKAYYLGSYDSLEDAAEARREAEEAINDEVTAFYDKWKLLAARDPAWAALNPIRIDVQKNNGRLRVCMQPELREMGEAAL